MNSAERIAAPQGANHRRKTVRRVTSAVALTSALLFGGAACTNSGDNGDSTPATELAPKQPEVQGTATEKLKNTTRPELSSAFDALLSQEACTDVVVLKNEGSWRSPDLTTEIVAEKGGTFLEFSRKVNTETGEVNWLFAQFYVPGNMLSPAERDALRSSDNPDGNRYGNSVEVFIVPGQDAIRIDANGHDEQGIFSTQGDLFRQNTEPYEYFGDPLVAVERAQKVVAQVTDFLDVVACTAQDPNVIL